MITFGSTIRDARIKKSITLLELASQIKKDDGWHISSVYLCDIEHNRRNPNSDWLIEQLALKLDVSSDILYFYVGKLPPDIRNMEISKEQIIEAFQDFRDALEK